MISTNVVGHSTRISHQEHQRKILVVSFDATMQMQLQAQQIIERHRQQLLQLLLQLHRHFLQLSIHIHYEK